MTFQETQIVITNEKFNKNTLFLFLKGLSVKTAKLALHTWIGTNYKIFKVCSFPTIKTWDYKHQRD